MSSSRFPKKVMREVYDHKTVLDCVIEQLSSSKVIDDVVVATESVAVVTSTILDQNQNPAPNIVNNKPVKLNILKLNFEFVNGFEALDAILCG